MTADRQPPRSLMFVVLMMVMVVVRMVVVVVREIVAVVRHREPAKNNKSVTNTKLDLQREFLQSNTRI